VIDAAKNSRRSAAEIRKHCEILAGK